MQIAIVGAGAIGSFFAASLDHARHRVIVAARGKRLEFLRNHPLQVVSCGQIIRHHVEVTAPDGLVGPIDLAICCVKTPDFATALTALIGKLSPDGVVLTVQNGVEAHEIAEDFLPGTMVVAGRFHGFFEMDGDVVRHTAVPPSLVFGCTRGKPEAAHDVVLTALGGSGFNTEASPDISRALWEKFMLAASLGGVATALEVPAGQVCTEPHGDELLRAAMEEVAALARCAGIALTSDNVTATMSFVRTFPAEATTSLQRDLELGRTSEYDALLGAIPRLAQRYGYKLAVFPRLEGMLRDRSLP